MAFTYSLLIRRCWTCWRCFSILSRLWILKLGQWHGALLQTTLLQSRFLKKNDLGTEIHALKIYLWRANQNIKNTVVSRKLYRTHHTQLFSRSVMSNSGWLERREHSMLPCQAQLFSIVGWSPLYLFLWYKASIFFTCLFLFYWQFLILTLDRQVQALPPVLLAVCYVRVHFATGAACFMAVSAIARQNLRRCSKCKIGLLCCWSCINTKSLWFPKFFKRWIFRLPGPLGLVVLH